MNSIETFLQSQSMGMRHAVPFMKVHGLGNDFVLVHEHDLQQAAAAAGIHGDIRQHLPRMASAICDRHFGIGADGFILVCDTSRPDCQISWLYLNSDGSSSAMCGNGLRCLALYGVLTGIVQPPFFTVQTEIGPVPVHFESAGAITSDLGEPILEAQRIPVTTFSDPAEHVVRREIATCGGTYCFTSVSMGNPHCVIFVPSLPDEKTMLAAAMEIQCSPVFPEGVNVEFVLAESRERARVYVVERGCGPTLACATGAAAVLVAGVLENVLDRAATIALPGGELKLLWAEADNRVRISGPAKLAFEGLFDLLQYVSAEGGSA